LMAGKSGKIITFYSYKGGTGRTTAVSNIAWILSSNGCRVLLIDWDLEAPGLHRHLRPFLGDPELNQTPGLLDFLWDATQSGGWTAGGRPLPTYAVDLKWSFSGGGRIALIPAGRQDDDYAKRVSSLGVSSFYRRSSGAKILQAAADALQAEYDYVLIDSHAGVSDSKDICTVQMPDALVLLFTLNEPSIDGSVSMAEHIRHQRAGLPIFPVPALIENREARKLASARSYARRMFAPFLLHVQSDQNEIDPGQQSPYWREVETPYVSYYAYEQIPAAFAEEPGNRQGLLASYERITYWMTQGAVTSLQPESEERRRSVIALYASKTSAAAEPAFLPSPPRDDQVRSVIKKNRLPVVIKYATAGQKITRLAFATMAAVVLIAGIWGAARLLNKRQLEIDHLHANFLAELSRTRGLKGQYDSALRLALIGTRIGLSLPSDAANASSASAALATAVFQAEWRLALGGYQGPVASAAFSPNGSRIVTASGDTARIWDAATAQEIAVLRGHDERVNSAAFSPDGSRVVTTSGDTARIWDAATAQEIAVLRGHNQLVNSAAFSPNGSRIVTASWDKTARIWDAATAREIAVLRGHSDWVRSAAFSPDGRRIVTASWDNTARIWDAATAKEIAVLRHDGTVNSAAFSPDGQRIVTGLWDNTARTWDAATGKEIVVLRGHDGPVNSAAFSLDGSRVVTASADQTARVWDAATAKEMVVLRGHDGKVASAAFSPNGSRIVTASWDKTARIWDAATAREIAVLRGHDGTVASAAFSPNGSRIVTASFDKTARIWDAATAREIVLLRGDSDYVRSAAFSPDGSRVVTASFDKTARVWDAATGKEIVVLRGHDGPVNSAAFSPDGSRIVTASADQTARVWDAATAKEMVVLRGHDGTVASAAFSPNGSRIVTASADQTARVWDAATVKEIAVLRGHDGTVASAAFSPDGSRVVTASWDKTARIWDAATAREIAVLRGHDGTVASAAFSPNGSRIVTASWDNTARIWDAATAREIAVLRDEGSVYSAAFSPDGSRIVTASEDRSARIWDVRLQTMSVKDLLAEACVRLAGLTKLTRDEMRLAGYPDSQPEIDVCR
jgi:WD40 repeat protein/MinD-like ATPase involved in chromosome partitioning or flagellar assembly